MKRGWSWLRGIDMFTLGTALALIAIFVATLVAAEVVLDLLDHWDLQGLRQDSDPRGLPQSVQSSTG